MFLLGSQPNPIQARRQQIQMFLLGSQPIQPQDTRPFHSIRSLQRPRCRLRSRTARRPSRLPRFPLPRPRCPALRRDRSHLEWDPGSVSSMAHCRCRRQSPELVQANLTEDDRRRRSSVGSTPHHQARRRPCGPGVRSEPASWRRHRAVRKAAIENPDARQPGSLPALVWRPPATPRRFLAWSPRDAAARRLAPHCLE